MNFTWNSFIVGTALILSAVFTPLQAAELTWPIDCIPGKSCLQIGYPDVDGDGRAFNCSYPGYTGHTGTDIKISDTAMDDGVDVFAASEGRVLWAFDGKYDKCPNDAEPDCQPPKNNALGPGLSRGNKVCTRLGPYCKGGGSGRCFWCFSGNWIVIKHDDTGVFATFYGHLKKDSIIVSEGDKVKSGQIIAKVGSSGRSTAPHLHFEVWGSGYKTPVEPWIGKCGPNRKKRFWKDDPPWKILNPDGDDFLKNEDIVSLISSHTLTGFFVSGQYAGTTFDMFMMENGNLSSRFSDGTMGFGRWRVKAGGKLCTRQRNIKDGKEICRLLRKDGDGYVLIRPKDNSVKATFRVLPGNAKNMEIP